MEPLLIKDLNLSGAWYNILEHFASHPGDEICPLILSLTEFDESSEIRQLLNEDLNIHELPTIQTVSETIFPQSIYQLCDFDRIKFYKQYMQNFRFIKGDPANRKGTYFQRMIAYEDFSPDANGPVNQLEIIIAALQDKKGIRRSKLQASIFDPTKDHSDGIYQKFPCLQHVTFYKSENGGLVLNSFYAMQYFYRRAYGNWLGLINLGKFVARESGLEFERFNCYIGVEKLDNIKKEEAVKMVKKIAEILV